MDEKTEKNYLTDIKARGGARAFISNNTFDVVFLPFFLIR